MLWNGSIMTPICEPSKSKGAGFKVWYLEQSATDLTSHNYPMSQELFILKATSTPWGALLAHMNYSDTRAFPVLPGTHLLLGRESAHAGKVPCPGAQLHSTIKPSQWLAPATSCLQVAHATTEPWCGVCDKALDLVACPTFSNIDASFREIPNIPANFHTQEASWIFRVFTSF